MEGIELRSLQLRKARLPTGSSPNNNGLFRLNSVDALVLETHRMTDKLVVLLTCQGLA
jgi:hypothetical protein